MMGKTIIDVYSMYVSPIPAKNDWMLLVQRMFSYLKQGWTVMKWNIKLCEQLQTSYLAHRTAFQSFLDSCKCLLQRLKPMQICKGVTKHRLPCMMMVSSSSIFEIIWVYAKMLGIPKRIRTKKTATKKMRGNFRVPKFETPNITKPISTPILPPDWPHWHQLGPWARLWQQGQNLNREASRAGHTVDGRNPAPSGMYKTL